ncbi:hypothetical protein Hanom_Chr00s000001g01596851 [Helianthus anomalus]
MAVEEDPTVAMVVSRLWFMMRVWCLLEKKNRGYNVIRKLKEVNAFN